ncbi:MAG: hypothetical protein L3V56_10690 [Candidatus Magnetoovum sp. WYHC-5]|nr:hypothetical protein [Candidatus Magnetoovum sp. WYHC-5]
MIERKVYYFEKPGAVNTVDCLAVVKDAIESRVFRHIVVATTGGDTGLLFSETFKDNRDVNLVAITHSYGFKEPNTIEITEAVAAKIRQNGAKLYTGTMITHSIETAFASAHNGLYPTTIVAQTLRRFGEGAKVCCECVMMAVDAGLIPENQEVVAVAGTGRGADTVTVIKSAASKRFFDLKVLEFLAKPIL